MIYIYIYISCFKRFKKKGSISQQKKKKKRNIYEFDLGFNNYEYHIISSLLKLGDEFLKLEKAIYI